METKIFTKNDLHEAAAIIRDGGVVAMPTETVYGLAANALDEAAVRKIYTAKGRQSDNPLIVHIANISDWGKLVEEIPKKAKLLAERFWPGPLTIILKKSAIVPDIVSGGLDTVAVRMPKNKIAFRFIKECGVPLAAPSANLSGAPSPTRFHHVLEDMNGRVEGIIDGGDCMVGLESTVISLASETPIILRPGRITAEQLRKVIGEVDIHSAATNALQEGEEAASPGMKYKHYAPKAELKLIDADDDAFVDYVSAHADENTAIICFEQNATRFKKGAHVFSLGEREDSVTQGKRLFEILREIDAQSLTKAFAPLPQSKGVGLAVTNRLLRAAGFRVIHPGSDENTINSPTNEALEDLHQSEKQQPLEDENGAVQEKSDAQEKAVKPTVEAIAKPQNADEASVEIAEDIPSIDSSAFEEDSAILALIDVKLSEDFNEDFSKEISDSITVVEKTSEDDPSKIFYEALLDEDGAKPAAYPVDSIGEDFHFDVYDDDLKPKKRGFFARLFGKEEEEELSEPEPFLPLPNHAWNSLSPIKHDGDENQASEAERNKLAAQISGARYEKIPGIRVVGLTGKSGCGKTYIAKRLAQKTPASCIIDADEVYHTMLESDSMILSLVIAFGDSILEGKSVNRKTLAKLAFASEENLQKLNKAVLPAVAEQIIKMIGEEKNKGTRTVFLDAPTLIESGLNQICNEVIFITADPAIRQERIVERDNITLDEIGQRMRFEKDDAFYVRFADRIIRNN